jgi:hypothetical protein
VVSSPRDAMTSLGVQGALTRQADTALSEAIAASHRGRREVIAGLLRLVTMDDQGRPIRWRVPRDELPGPVIRELDAFVQRRLVSTDTDDDGSVVVGVAHEAFLSAWSPPAQAIKENASALRDRRAVRAGRHRLGQRGSRTGPVVGTWTARLRGDQYRSPPPSPRSGHRSGGAQLDGAGLPARQYSPGPLEDVDWGGQLIYVVSKGTRLRQPIPASPDAFRYLAVTWRATSFLSLVSRSGGTAVAWPGR